MKVGQHYYSQYVTVCHSLQIVCHSLQIFVCKVDLMTYCYVICMYYLGKKFSDTYGLWYVFPPFVVRTHVPDCFWFFLYSY